MLTLESRVTVGKAAAGGLFVGTFGLHIREKLGFRSSSGAEADDLGGRCDTERASLKSYVRLAHIERFI